MRSQMAAQNDLNTNSNDDLKFNSNRYEEREGGGAGRKIETGSGKEGEHGERIRASMERKEGEQIGKERKSRREGEHIHAEKR